MSPELERLLEAYYEERTGSPVEKPERIVTLKRLLDEVLAHSPGTSRAALLEALQTRYRAFRCARRKTATLPPRA